MLRAGLIALVGAVCAACATAQSQGQTQGRTQGQAESQKEATADGLMTEMGAIGEATFRIDMPDDWNGGLVVMNHGYSPEPRHPRGGPPSRRIEIFTERGFAVAQSSYSRGGWAVEDAMIDNEKLRQYFIAEYGEPNRVIATGGAMGASTTTASVEMFPEIYDAGLVTCCSGLDPRLENMNWNFEMLALFDYYFPNVMPSIVGGVNGMPYSIGANSEAAQRVQAALDANPEKAEIFRRAWGRKAEDVARTVAFHTYLIHEAQDRSGGNPFSNMTTLYNVDDDLVAVNAGVKRYAADPGANAYLKKWYTATGKVTKPLMILSPIYDAIVPVQTTEAYMTMVRREGNDHMVTFQYFDRFGHGSVTNEEVEAAFDDLLAWMDGGPQPPSGRGVNRGEGRRR